jgi:hypothetical protein
VIIALAVTRDGMPVRLWMPSGLQAVQYRCESRTIVHHSKITAELSRRLKP